EVLDGNRLYSIVGDRYASIVEEAVHPPPLQDTCIDHSFDIGFSRNVSLDEVASVGSERIRKGLAKLCATPADDDLCTLRDEALGCAPTHSACCSRDDCYLSI